MKHIIYYRKKPYYYYKTFYDWKQFTNFKKKYTKLHYFYVKTLNKRTGGTAYAIYLDHMVH